ncbi:MAG: transcription-repair coupling factor [Firmicutes bacterium]|nr:transcription-repair coupling factor [Bacillota bacterium]
MGKLVNLTGLSEIRIAPLAANFIKERNGQGLILTTSASRAKRIASDLSFFTDVRILVLPDVESASFRYEAKSTAQLQEEIAGLAALGGDEKVIVIAPVLGALKKLPPPDVFFRDSIVLENGSSFSRDELIARLARMGYEREAAAEAGGQFAVRGDIVDVFVPGRDDPVRIEFFDTDIDSIRSFDAATQRSKETLDSVRIWPAQVMVRNEEAFARGLKNISSAYARSMRRPLSQEQLDKLRERRDYLIECVEEGMNYQYLEGFLSYFYEQPALVWDYVKDPAFLFVDDPSRMEEILNFYDKEEEENRRVILERCFGVPEDFRSLPDRADLKKTQLQAQRCDVYYCTPFTQQIPYTDRLDEIVSYTTKQAPVFNGHMEPLEQELKRYAKNGYRIVIACSSEDRISNLKDFLGRAGLENRVELRYGRLSQGTEFFDDKILYLSESDIFVHTKSQTRRKKSKGREIKAFTDIKKGDYVVHEAHGVGRFVGIEKLTVDGSQRDYLKIRYAGEDVLYVPVDQMESIQKYVGSESVAPKINRLSGGDWQKTKARAKAAIRDMAEDFLRLSAQRQMTPGFAFGPDSAWQKEFEDAFPYEETADQLRAAEEIKKDMQSPNAMDRLLCGDVGYGKTEVAARAIFKCLEEGKQAAVLVPTTILANQHYHTFLDRFKEYPFNVEMLSRFRTEKQQEKVLKGLASGDVDLVVGTHRLLSGDVKFKDLGLLVVDEEQRFGVEHKDAIKKLKMNVDVLTLSATPIPRTLHMSLIGVRDMSVLEEPPEDRYPVQTYVMEQDDLMIADAIRRELGRGGQVYVVYNRVSGIQTVARRIRELVPEANVVVGHGQMGERELEDVMMKFLDGEHNVLVATTIIESGLDIPNVNTMIIMDADRFGLSQLYQLRGRVGRSNRMAYAYLVYKKDKVLSEVAEKRLRAIREFTEFGAGFRVAMRDLELRGAGNILGVEQSGHMLSVGYELYCKLVEETVRELQGGMPEEAQPEADTSVELGIPAFLPESYVADELTRLSMYKRIASIASDDDKYEVTDELLDRFGDLPRPAQNLLDIALIRSMASRCGISKVALQHKKLVLLFEEKNCLGPELFAALMDDYGLRLTIYGGVEPRVALALDKAPAAQEAEVILTTMLAFREEAS